MTTTPAPLIPFAIEGDHTGDVFYAVRLGATWNGWARPFVTRETADTIAAMYGGSDTSLVWDGDTLVHTYIDGEVERIDPTPDGLYDVQMGWVWDVCATTDDDA